MKINSKKHYSSAMGLLCHYCTEQKINMTNQGVDLTVIRSEKDPIGSNSASSASSNRRHSRY
jgi:hypothetical protein